MTATLPTCSGVFFRLHCRHQQLFEKEYKRSNRNRGTKILRCFPHCCPSHVERSYCGSSLELAVEFHQPLPVDAHSLFVFARFETVDLENPLAVGEICSLRHLQNVSQSETNPEATWIQGAFQPRAATATTSVFLLNGLTSSKWYYHWESGANKARRLTKHLLKAYILYRRGGQPNSSDASSDRVQVIGTVNSPPFTLVSYRRAAWEGLDGMDDAAYAGDGDTGNDYDLQQVVQDQISQAFQESQKQSSGVQEPVGELKHPVRASLDHDPRLRHSFQGTDAGEEEDHDEEPVLGCDSCGHYRRAQPPTTTAVVRDHWTWERQHTAMTLHMKDIAIIYYFISNAPMALVVQSYRVREHVYAALQRDWASDASPSTANMRRHSTAPMQQPAILLSLLFPSQDGAFTTTNSSASRSGTSSANENVAMTSQLENLLLVVTKLAISLLASENLALFQDFFDRHAKVLLRKRCLRNAFLHLAGLLCKRIHVFWSSEVKAAANDGSAPRDSAFKALRTMSEHIIALSHSHMTFKAMWPDLREIMEAPGTIMWESFIAQLRETYSRKEILTAQGDKKHRPQEAHRNVQKFTGIWGLDASTASTERASSEAQPTAPRGFETPSISGTLLAMVQLQTVHLRIPSKDILLVRSDNSLLPDENPWMQLVCDGRARTTSAYPLGLSSLIGSQLLGGDYVASMDPMRSRIQIDLFWWPLHSAKVAAAHAVRVTLTLHLLANASDFQVTLALQHGTLTRNAATRPRLARIDLCSPRERTTLCGDWALQWKAHVGFTLIERGRNE